MRIRSSEFAKCACAAEAAPTADIQSRMPLGGSGLQNSKGPLDGLRACKELARREAEGAVLTASAVEVEGAGEPR